MSLEVVLNLGTPGPNEVDTNINHHIPHLLINPAWSVGLLPRLWNLGLYLSQRSMESVQVFKTWRGKNGRPGKVEKLNKSFFG